MYAIFNRTVSISHHTGGTEQKVFEYVPGALSLHSKTDVCSLKWVNLHTSTDSCKVKCYQLPVQSGVIGKMVRYRLRRWAWLKPRSFMGCMYSRCVNYWYHELWSELSRPGFWVCNKVLMELDFISDHCCFSSPLKSISLQMDQQTVLWETQFCTILNVTTWRPYVSHLFFQRCSHVLMLIMEHIFFFACIFAPTCCCLLMYNPTYLNATLHRM